MSLEDANESTKLLKDRKESFSLPLLYCANKPSANSEDEGTEMRNYDSIDASSISVSTSTNEKRQDAIDTNGKGKALEAPSSSGGFFSWLFPKSGSRVIEAKMRHVPIKVEPKVFFANERTFLSWLHMSITLATISVAIVAFAESNDWSQLYGLILLPVAIVFCVYSLLTYIKRSDMLRKRLPGPYEDRIGVVCLACFLAFAIIANFCIKLYDLYTGF